MATTLTVTITVDLVVDDEAALIGQGGDPGLVPPVAVSELAACVGKLTSATRAVSAIAGVRATGSSVGVGPGRAVGG